MTPAAIGSLAWEQQHEYLEPDADSACPCEMACHQCPPNRKRVIMRKIIDHPAWRYATLAIGFAMGLILAIVILYPTAAHSATTPPCNTGARILCGVKPLPKHAPAKHHKPRTSGPIARV